MGKTQTPQHELLFRSLGGSRFKFGGEKKKVCEKHAQTDLLFSCRVTPLGGFRLKQSLKVIMKTQNEATFLQPWLQPALSTLNTFLLLLSDVSNQIQWRRLSHKMSFSYDENVLTACIYKTRFVVFWTAHIHPRMAEVPPDGSSRALTLNSHQEQTGVQCLAEGHVHIQSSRGQMIEPATVWSVCDLICGADQVCSIKWDYSQRVK